MSQLLDWAALGKQHFPDGAPQTGGVPQNTWNGNNLQLPQGIGDIIAQAGTPGGGAAVSGGVGGAIGGGGGGGSITGGPGGFNPAALFQQRPDVLQAYNNLTDDDRAFLTSAGYPTTSTGYAQYWYDTYGADAGLTQPAASTASVPAGGGGQVSAPPLTSPAMPAPVAPVSGGATLPAPFVPQMPVMQTPAGGFVGGGGAGAPRGGLPGMVLR